MEVYGVGRGSGSVQVRIPGPQQASAYGEGRASGSISLLTPAPLGAFDDFAMWGVASEPDPAMTFVSESTGGTTVPKGSGWKRHYLMATPPTAYPVSGRKVAWKEAAFAAVGFKLTGMVPNNFVYLENVQLEVIGLDKQAPMPYENPRRIRTVVRPDRLNYARNPSFEVNEAFWSALAGASVSRDTAVAYPSGASGKVTVPKVSTANLALQKRVTSSSGSTNIGVVVDGSTPSGAFFSTDTTGLQHVIVDLGAIYNINEVKRWHYYDDGRTYYQTKTEVSEDGTTWHAVFDSGKHGSNRLIGAGYEGALDVDVAGYGAVTPVLVTGGRTGSQAVAVTTDAITAQGIIHMTPVGTAVPLGTKVRCGAWVKVEAGRVLNMSGRVYEAGANTYIAEAKGSVSFTGTGDWQYVQTSEWTLDTHTVPMFRPGWQITSTDVVGLVITADDSFVTVQGSNNLVSDGSYEAGIPAEVSGYFGAVVTRVTPGFSSANAISITTDSATNPQGMSHTAPMGTLVQAGTRIRCSGWVKAPLNQAMILAGRASEVSSNTQLTEGGGSVSFTGTGDWQYVQTTEWTFTQDFRPGMQVRLADGAAASGVRVDLDQTQVYFRGEYIEYSAGRTNTFPIRRARYIRDWLNGSTANAGNHWVEIQATGLMPAANAGISHVVTNLTVGRNYVASAWILEPQESLRLRMVASGQSSMKVALTDGPWKRVYVRFVANSATQEIGVLTAPDPEDSESTVASLFWVDSVMVEEGDHPLRYFDGSYGTDYLWEAKGAAGLTRSYHYAQIQDKHSVLQRLLEENTPVGISAREAEYAPATDPHYKQLLTTNQRTFESATDIGWFSPPGGNSTFARSTAQAKKGQYSMAITASAAGTVQVITNNTLAMTPGVHRAVPGETYEGSTFFKAGSTGRQCRVQIGFYDTSGRLMGDYVLGTSVDNVTNEWTRTSVTAVAPAGTGFVALMGVVFSLASGEVHYMDEASLYLIQY